MLFYNVLKKKNNNIITIQKDILYLQKPMVRRGRVKMIMSKESSSASGSLKLCQSRNSPKEK